MNFREVTLLSEKTLGDSGTEPIPLDLTEPITQLVIKFKQRNPTSSYNDYPPERSITKIEIVDGGKSIWSLNGREAVGVATVDDGCFPSGVITGTLSRDVQRYIPIRFGRYIGDPDFAFDPTKLRNPTLQVTYGLSGHLTALNKIEVFAKVMSGVPAPPKCLVWRSIRGYTAVANSTEETPLPVDYPYRRIMFRGFNADDALSSLLNHYKLACDIDRLVLFDVSWEDMEDLMYQQFGYIENNLHIQSKGGIPVQTYMCPTVGAQGGVETEDVVATMAPAWGQLVTLVCSDFTEAHVDSNVSCKFTGLNPHGCVIYEFGLRDKPDTWFRASQFKNVKAILEHDVTGEVTVAVQQPVTLGSP